MAKQNKALICACFILINNIYSSDMHANKQLVNSEIGPKTKVLPKTYLRSGYIRGIR